MSLELKKKEMEIKRVVLAKEEMELRIEERKDEIRRLEENMRIQDDAVVRISAEIEVIKKKLQGEA